MKRNGLKMVLLGLTLMTLGCLGTSPAWAAYNLTWYTTPYAQPFGINNSGEVVGGVPINGLSQGFIGDTSGAINTYLTAPGATTTWAEGINKNTVVGWSIYDEAVVPTGYRGFFYDRNTATYTMYDAKEAETKYGYTVTGATIDAINDNGDFVGHFFVEDGGLNIHHGYTNIGGVFTEVNAFDINGTYSTDVDALTNSNDISGHYKDGALTRGFMRLNGVMTNIPLPVGADEMELERMNTIHQAVGYLNGPGYQNAAFILDGPNGVPTQLFAPGMYMATFAEGINDSGVIVGYVYDSAVGYRGYIATPSGAVPEPSTFLLTGAGIVALGFLARRRNRTSR